MRCALFDVVVCVVCCVLLDRCFVVVVRRCVRWCVSCVVCCVICVSCGSWCVACCVLVGV